MSGWSGATSASVRAIATAVSGSFDGALMIASLRVITVAEDRHRRNKPTVARRDVQRPRAEGAHSQFPSVTERLRYPAVEVAEPDLAVGDLEDVRAGEQRLQDLVAVLEHVRRQGVRQQGGLVRLLKMRVALEVERVAQSL